MIILNIKHSRSGKIGKSRKVDVVPFKGDCILLNSELYIIKQVIWDYTEGTNSVDLIVEEKENV